MASDYLKIIKEIRGTGAPEAEYTDDIYHDLTIKDYNGNSGIYGDIVAKYGGALTANSDASASAAAALISEQNAAASEAQVAIDAAAIAAINIAQLAADAEASSQNRLLTAADAEQTALDVIATANNLAQTNQDTIDTAADVILTHADVAITNANAAQTIADASSTAANALSTSADAVSTSLDAAATAANVITTNANVITTNADAVQTALDVIATNQDTIDTAADRAQTGLDAITTAADRVQTELDAAATAADRVQTGLDAASTAADVVSTNADAASTAQDAIDTAADAATATTKAGEALTSATNAASSEDMAQEWAEKTEDIEITGNVGSYSALHHAAKASEDALSASGSASAASISASNAATSETNAGTSESNAATSEFNAGNSSSVASTSAANALTSETNAATSESNSATSAIESNNWATFTIDVPVPEGNGSEYSARHWASKAAAAVTGQLTYMGTWNATQTFPTNPTIGHYYKVVVAGPEVSSPFTYNTGDSIIYNGVDWDLIDSSDAVNSVDGQIGAVSLSNVYEAKNTNIQTHISTTTGNPHNVLATQISDFNTEVANNAAVAANTAKVSNVTTNLSTTYTTTSATIVSSDGTNAVIGEATGAQAGLMSVTHHNKLDGIETGATADQVASEVPVTASGNLTSTNVQAALTELQGDINTINTNAYIHPTHPGDDFSVDTGALSGATVVSDIDINVTTDAQGHVTDANGVVATRTLTLADLGYTGSTTANNYTHPSYTGDDFSIDTTPLSGATVISDLDINVTTDTLGHVTDANGVVSTRTLTTEDLGFSTSEKVNYDLDTAFTNGMFMCAPAVNYPGTRTTGMLTVASYSGYTVQTWDDGDRSYVRRSTNNNSAWEAWSRVVHSDGDITGNASTATWADTVDVNSGNTSATWYDAVWHSGDTLYSSTGVEIQGSTNSLRATNLYTTNMYVDDYIFSTGDIDTYMQFHASNEWRVVAGGAERLEVNSTQTTVRNGDLDVHNSLNLGTSKEATIKYNSTDNSIDFIIN